MADELKPCPFCGGEARMFYVDGWARPRCKCGANSGVLAGSDAEAIAAWNRRPAPAPDALREAGEALEPFDFYDFAPEDGWSDTDELEVHAPDGILIHCLKVGDIRRATAALARLKEGDSGATDQPKGKR